ncbi:hypothetical protein MCAP1_002065 [Malassezia caprae]|uniref:Protein ORM1 n=1 Tax=Malassezia caprae TaxID=1381934 RepID=A0AAF0J0A2_9BASI|nr:hypothetical protein MCAP1_002065 [Malassezia caprae]
MSASSSPEKSRTQAPDMAQTSSEPLLAPSDTRPSTSRHRRSNSFLMVKHMQETPDEEVDQSVSPNVNAEWVNMKGAWVIHVVLVVLAKLIINEIPGISNSIKWTIINVGYMIVSYVIFHYVKGAPLDLNSGAYDELTLWEQIDQGFQYTPAKKYLTSLPIALFLLSTHYSHYNPWLFTLNLAALLFVLFPKLPVALPQVEALPRAAPSCEAFGVMESATPRERPPDASPSILKNPLHHIPRWSRERGGYVTYVRSPRTPFATHAVLVLPKRSLPHTWPYFVGHNPLCRWLARSVRMNHWFLHHRSRAPAVPSEMEPMDPEELAMLNSIINTRCSMAAAQALAKQKSIPDTPRTTPSAITRVAQVHFAPLPFPEDDMDAQEPEAPEAPSTPASDAQSAEESPRPSLERGASRRSLWPWSLSSDALSLRRWPSTQRSDSLEELESPPRTPSPPISIEERRRRRRHILSQRPGGTGMVTLLDGERIPARQVGDPQQEQDMDDDLQAQLWGFAALERQRARVQAASPSHLSSARAAEVRRRHEDEMTALGVEALKKVRGDKAKSHESAEPRCHTDPSISMPSPSPHLPRRPDAKGIVVVPLPQLGRRPKYPYEGHSWLYKLPLDDMDMFSDTKSHDEGSAPGSCAS